MKKFLGLAILILATSSVGFAKVTGFNSLIDDNVAAQKELHAELTTQVGEPKFEKSKTATFVDLPSSAVNSPTNKKSMRFRKEIVEHANSDRKSSQRLANELKSAEMAF